MAESPDEPGVLSFRDESRRRRGCNVDIPRGRFAATPRPRVLWSGRPRRAARATRRRRRLAHVAGVFGSGQPRGRPPAGRARRPSGRCDPCHVRCTPPLTCRRRVAAPPRVPRGYSLEATPWLRAGSSAAVGRARAEASLGRPALDAVAATTWIFRGDEKFGRKYAAAHACACANFLCYHSPPPSSRAEIT